MQRDHISVEFPTYLLQTMSKEQLRHLAQEAFLVRLYERGFISSGQAGEMLGIPRSDVLDLLSAYGISYFDATTDLAEDPRNAHVSDTGDVSDSMPPARG